MTGCSPAHTDDPLSTWTVHGCSEVGSPGEDCGFSLGVAEPGKWYISCWMEYASDTAQLTLTEQQVAELRATLNRAAERQNHGVAAVAELDAAITAAREVPS